MIKHDVKDDDNELRDYVDDMVLFKEGDTKEEAILLERLQNILQIETFLFIDPWIVYKDVKLSTAMCILSKITLSYGNHSGEYSRCFQRHGHGVTQGFRLS